jgi:HSP20 family protein
MHFHPMQHRLQRHPFRMTLPFFRSYFPLAEEEEVSSWLQEFAESSGLSVWEDEKAVYIEAAVPGMKADDIEMTFHNGVLVIKAEKKEEEEDKNKKFYKKAVNAFSYQIDLPAKVDESKQPEAICKNGILRVVFTKGKPKGKSTIPIKEE